MSETKDIDAINGSYKIRTDFDTNQNETITTVQSAAENIARADNKTNQEPCFSIELTSKSSNDDPEKMTAWQTFLDTHKSKIQIMRKCLIHFSFGAYFAWATAHYMSKREQEQCDIQWCDGYGMLFLLTVFVYTYLFYSNILRPVIKRLFGKSLNSFKNHILKLFTNLFIKLIVIGVVLIIFGVFIAYDTIGSRERLRSLLGIVVLLGIGFIFSKDRRKINWRTVLNGLFFQFMLGIFCIRMEFGRKVFECLGKKAARFFEFALDGSKFVYGDYLIAELHVFAFSVLPIIFFFSFIVSILYFYGAMQWIIQKMGSTLQSLLGTTFCEGVIAAGNIFLGMSESPLLIKPYLKYLTASEIHVIMASGFATVSGSSLAAYISYGAEASHLITSTVMAAPAALAFSKLFYPEMEVSQISKKTIQMETSKDKTVLDAASNGAFEAINLIAGIIANLVAFVSFIAFLNALISWFGMLVGHEYISFLWLFGKLFIPLAYSLGIPWEDCEQVGTVIATKSIVNEFVAYQKLGALKSEHLISLRSSAITTYAICGFANFSSLGMMIGNLGTLSPEKRTVITSVAVRALIAGSIICFLNASIAGLLMTEEIFT